ncbi:MULTISPECIES: tryptophanase [unclassified Nocardioides]|uniref:tryptophanase n=1 Tax=unclassified Nocardioides TaxID=2615069 RepID=UPI0000574B84|nr:MULTISPECIES: tryptophanase [unclassified Nocardioides]ABL81137.1 tryptophanase [Nocardioides sp. JS614]
MDQPFRTIIEPFRIHSVEPMRMTTAEERRTHLAAVDYNLFQLRAEHVLIDLLTDSGTGAMSRDQWAAVQRGDESYAGSPSYFVFRDAVRRLFDFEHIIPVHQGRAAERILFSVLGGAGKVIPNNTHFDTTRANIEATGAEAVDLVIAEGRDPRSDHPFKGNMDLAALEQLLEAHADDVPCVMVTITNNSGGGQPVSLANLRGVRALCDRFGKPLFLDACRFAENAWFIREREAGQGERDVVDIIRDVTGLADGVTMSAKKDPLGNIGGWLALADDDLAAQCRNIVILTEGFPTYGGLAGRDLEALAQGLAEVVQHDYLRYRIGSTAYLGRALAERGVPVLSPFGGHAIYLDARALLPHLDPLEYPGQAVAVALYEIGGIRSCEIGTVMFGRHPDGSEQPAAMDLVRLAIPRRTYTQSHIDYVIEVCERILDRASDLPGYRIVEEPPALRHFTARFAPLGRTA